MATKSVRMSSGSIGTLLSVSHRAGSCAHRLEPCIIEEVRGSSQVPAFVVPPSGGLQGALTIPYRGPHCPKIAETVDLRAADRCDEEDLSSSTRSGRVTVSVQSSSLSFRETMLCHLEGRRRLDRNGHP